MSKTTLLLHGGHKSGTILRCDELLFGASKGASYFSATLDAPLTRLGSGVRLSRVMGQTQAAYE